MRPKIAIFALLTVLTTISVNLGLMPNPQSSTPNDAVLAQTADSLKLRGDRLLEIGIDHHKKGQFRAALQSMGEALNIYREISDASRQADSLSWIGTAYFSLGEYYQAIAFYQEQLAIAKFLGDRPGQEQALKDLSSAYFQMGQTQRAKELQQQALRVGQEIANPTGEGAFLSNVGLAYESRGQYEKAIEFYQQHLQISVALGDAPGQVYALNHLGMSYESLGKYEESIKYYQQQLGIAKAISDRPSIITALNSLAKAYESLGKYEEAVAFYQQEIEIARLVGDRSLEFVSLTSQAKAYEAQKKYDEAIALYQQQVEISEKNGDRLGKGTALNYIGFAQMKSGKFPESQNTLFSAIGIWQEIRAQVGNKDNYIQQQAVTYRTLQQIAIAQDQPEAALEIAEHGRARGFLDLLDTRLPPNKNEQLEIIPPNIEQIKQIAQTQKATIVEYSLIPGEGIYAWVIKPTGEITFRRIDPKDQYTIDPIPTIEKLIASIPAALGINSNKTEETKELADKVVAYKPLFQLHQILIKPIDDLLPKNPDDRVIFIPDKDLFFIPFPALADLFGQYLIEKHTIFTASSIQVLDLAYQQRQKVGGEKPLVVGNPKMPKVPPQIGQTPEELKPLLTAEQEAKAIGGLLKTAPIVGEAASKLAILQQLPKAKMIHFATYGLLDDLQDNRKGRPYTLPGAIALSPAGSDNGLLTTKDLINSFALPEKTPLRAELVVITAITSGQGRTTSEGIIGLSRAFISAGVPSVIMPILSVPDAPTLSLMTEFYQNLEQNPDKAKALRQAMLTIKEKNRNPKDWAFFSLIGQAD